MNAWLASSRRLPPCCCASSSLSPSKVSLPSTEEFVLVVGVGLEGFDDAGPVVCPLGALGVEEVEIGHL